MNTRLIAAEYRLAHWAGIMRERSESGLTVRAFCKQAGFHENSYFYWQKKLREAACGQSAETNTGSATTALAVKGFAEVKLSDPHRRLTSPDHYRQNGGIQIESAGIRITADSTYPALNLAELLKALVKSC